MIHHHLFITVQIILTAKSSGKWAENYSSSKVGIWRTANFDYTITTYTTANSGNGYNTNRNDATNSSSILPTMSINLTNRTLIFLW